MAIELSQVQPRNSVDDFVVLTREDLSDQVLEFCGGDVFCLDSKALKKKDVGYTYICVLSIIGVKSQSSTLKNWWKLKVNVKRIMQCWANLLQPLPVAYHVRWFRSGGNQTLRMAEEIWLFECNSLNQLPLFSLG